MPVTTTTVTGGIAVVRIEDPDRRNALSAALVDEVLAVADRDDVSAFVLTGSAGFFSAGADVGELLSGNWTGPDAAGPPRLFRRITEDHRPWVAAVNGPAIGGGCELALSCDLVLMASSTYLWLPEASLGVLPNTAAVLLRGTLPHAAATQLLLGLERVGAERAVALGLATASVEPAELDDAARAAAARVLASVAPSAFGLVKRALRAPDWERSAALLAEVDERELKVGIEAMLEKRRMDYTGHWTGERNGGDHS